MGELECLQRGTFHVRTRAKSRIDANADISGALVGKTLNAETIEAAAEAVAGAADPRTDHRGSAAYKRQVVKTFVTRILTNIAQSEPKAA